MNLHEEFTSLVALTRRWLVQEFGPAPTPPLMIPLPIPSTAVRPTIQPRRTPLVPVAKVQEPKGAFSLEPMKGGSPPDFNTIRKTLGEVVPDSAVVILTDGAHPEFFTKMAKAISDKLCPAHVISQLPQTTAGVRLIIAQRSFWTGSAEWQGVPVFLLDAVDLYIQEPQRKVPLWNNLCQLLRP